MDGWGGAALSVCKLISLSWYQEQIPADGDAWQSTLELDDMSGM